MVINHLQIAEIKNEKVDQLVAVPNQMVESGKKHILSAKSDLSPVDELNEGRRHVATNVTHLLTQYPALGKGK